MPKDPAPEATPAAQATATPAAQATAAPATQPVAAPASPMLVLTAADAARQRELDALLRVQAKQDAARANSPAVDMVANVGFTIVSDEHPDGQEIRPGQHFAVPGFDVPAFLGKARLASELAEEARGAKIS